MNVMSPKIKNKKRKVLKRSIFKRIAYGIFAFGLIKFGLTGEKKVGAISTKSVAGAPGMYFTYLPFGSIFACNLCLIAAFYFDWCHRKLARRSSLPSPARLTERNSWSSVSSESTVTSSFGSAPEEAKFN
jgi:hypothetical protein